MRPGDWRIWYADGSTFDSSQGAPWESPELYVVGITQNSNGAHYDLLASGEDHYIYLAGPGHWMEVDDRGLQDQLTLAARGITCYRAGFQMSLLDFQTIKARMQAHIDEHQVTVR